MATYLTDLVPPIVKQGDRSNCKDSFVQQSLSPYLSKARQPSFRFDCQTPFVVQPKDDFQVMMLLSALLLLPSMASAFTEAGYGTQLKRSYTPPTSELSDLRNFDQISYLATNDSLVRCLSICVC